MNGRAWSAIEDLELRDLFPHFKTATLAGLFGRSIPALCGHAQKLGLRKSPAYLLSADACRLRRGDNPGVAFRYKPGHVPANKGLRRPGWAPGRMRETQFRKGQRNGKAAAHVMPLGAERLIEGYLYVKVAEVPSVAYTVNWKPVHVLAWERANGKAVPQGHCLRFRDGNRLNVALHNLELVSRKQNVLRNTVHRYPPVVKRAIYARGALNRKINRLEKERAQDS